MSFFKSVFGRFFAQDSATPVKVAVEPVAPVVQQAVAAVEAETPELLTIWTIERNRYAAPRALCTEIEIYPSAALDLHEGIMGYVLDTPSGESVVVESRTGSLVGHSLEVVRDGVREMSKAQLNAQLDTARKEYNRMPKVVLPQDEFWKSIQMGSSDVDVVQDYQE